MSTEKPFIRLEELISSKSPRLLRLIPGFMLAYLKRIVHQDEVNDTMLRLKEFRGLEFIDKILAEFGADIRIRGAEHLEADTRLLVASNHPLGGLDGMALMQAVGRVHKDIVFPVNDLLMNIPNIRELFIPVNKHGSNAQNIRILDETFASGKTILFFPAGLCSRSLKGHITDLEWKKTFISKARRYRRNILPTHISGRNSAFFYRLANFRSSLGIRANLEMLYLVDEMFKQKDKVIGITFGRSIPWESLTKERTDLQWAGLIKQHVYRIGNGTDDFEALLARGNEKNTH
ncbi:MAG TPA: 1-acyl-sn-glycerol-3-phosphate acyltransferase [Bacteroidales bacterium]|nr:1-acyl-sn-glycerol-3-phosphate acyltransferase [Bacteroidales bacterium]HSA44377.1 1-acyl-sn-glycerol-3-phosphate acyltransferase [Bacteroidales bacterium]